MTGGGVQLLIDGRTAIAAVLIGLENNIKSEKVCYLPEYTCDTVILPFVKYNYKIYFYKIDRSLHIDEDSFESGLYRYKPDVILLHSYYGCDFQEKIYEEIGNFKKTYKTIVIEDLTQSIFLFSKAIQRADFAVCSLRKWFAIPDGGILIDTSKIFEETEDLKVCSYPEREEYTQTKLMAQRLKRLYLCGENIDKKQYLELNSKAESMLYDFKGVYGMSDYSKNYLCNLDFSEFKHTRKKNADLLCDELTKLGVQVLVHDRDAIPLYIPIFVENRNKIQEKLRQKEIYAPILWPVPEHVSKVMSKDAKYIYDHLLAVPCDQRYDEKDMSRVIDAFD